jgi:hypothetical protein
VRFEACSAFTARYGLHTRQVTKMTLYTEGFDCFVTSTAAPIATGWSDSCRAGLSPAEEPRLFTAHSKIYNDIAILFDIRTLFRLETPDKGL